MSRSEHPAQRSRRVQQLVDDLDTREWWEAEQAAAHRDRMIARLAATAAWCLAAFTGVAIVVLLVDTIEAM